MELTIYSYGYSEIIYQMLNALAMFRNSNFYTLVVETMVLLVGVISGVRIATTGVDSAGKRYVVQMLSVLIFVNSLLLPKDSMFIQDNVEKRLLKVDNIPLAFALPIGLIENFGHVLTLGFEQAFLYIDSRAGSGINSKSANSYYNYGTVFGARLSKEVLEAKIRDPEVTHNMRNFIQRCVVMPAMIGKKFTKEELSASTDIWGLVSRNAGTISRVDITTNGHHDTPTCKEAVRYFENKFIESEDNFIHKIMSKFRGAGGDISDYSPGVRRLNSNIKRSIASIYGLSDAQSVSNLIKHNMMINSLNDYRAGKFPNVRAQMQAEAGGFLSGDMAEKTLTGSLAVMKVLMYGSFIFLLPLLILTGGIRKYSMWIMAAFSLQLWPALFSMLNMIIDVAYDPSEVVSYSSWSSEHKKFDSIASTAANMTLMIPFLAMWITRLGEGGLMHLAGSIMSSAQSATGAIAGEKASGSIAYDNKNIRNSSSDMINSGKVDHNMQYVSGEYNYAMSDGTRVKVNQDGSSVYGGGAGITSSSGEASYHLGSGIDASLQQNYDEKQSIAKSKHDAFNQSKSNTISESVNYLKQISETLKTNESKTLDLSTEHGRAVNKALTEIESYGATDEESWEQNARAYMGTEGSVSASFAGVSGTAKAGLEAASAKNSRQSTSEDHKVNTEQDIRESRNNLLRALSSETFARELDSTGNLGKDYRASYEETTRLEKQLSISMEEAKSASDVMNYSKNNSAHTNQDVYQDVLDGVIKQGYSVAEAKKLVDTRSPIATNVFDNLIDNEVTELKHQIINNKYNKTGAATYTNESEAFENEHKEKVNNNAGQDIVAMANNDGLSADVVREAQEKTRKNNQEVFDREHEAGASEYDQISDNSTMHKEELKNKMQEYKNKKKK